MTLQTLVSIALVVGLICVAIALFVNVGGNPSCVCGHRWSDHKHSPSDSKCWDCGCSYYTRYGGRWHG